MLQGLVNEELTLEGVIVASWSVFKDNFWRIFVIGLLVDVPYLLINWNYPEKWWSALGAAVIMVFLSVLALVIVSIIVESSVLGEPLKIGDGFKRGVNVMGKILRVGMKKWLMILGHGIFLIVPGIIIGMHYLFSLFAVALRNVEGDRALVYSKRLVKKNWWMVIGITAGIAVFYLPFWCIPTMLVTFLTMGGMSNELWGTVPGILLAVLFNAYFMVVFTVFFLGVDYHTQFEKETEKGVEQQEGVESSIVAVTAKSSV